jgi:hypothetical protein
MRTKVRAGVATAVAQTLVMAGSSLLGLLIARELGSSGSTDGFFAANAVYAIALFTAQSLRTTAPATLIDRAPGTLLRHARAVAVIGAALLALFAILAGAASLLVSESAVRTFRVALAVLSPAAIAQLAAGLLAARCAVLGEFGRPAAAYASGAILSAALFAVLVHPIGVDATAVAVSGGAITSLISMWFVWRSAELRASNRPTDSWSVPALHVPRLVPHLLRGAIPVLASQALLTVSVFSAGLIAAGDPTLYSYGMLAVMVLVAIIAAPVSIVLAPDVARRWDRDPATLVAPTLDAYRLGALLLPVLALPGLLWGPSIADVLLTALSREDIVAIFTVAAILSVSVLTTLLSMVPLVGAVAAGLLSRVGFWAVIVVICHLMAAPLVALSGSLTLVAVEGMVASMALAYVPIAVAIHRSTVSLTETAFQIAVRYVLPSVSIAAITWITLGAGIDFVRSTVALVVGLTTQLIIALTIGRRDLRAVLSAVMPRWRIRLSGEPVR